MNKKQVAEKFIKLLEIVEKLRGPDGCPWDKEQTHASLLPYLIEEAYEVVESVEEGDIDLLEEELGDIMLHVALQTQIASENNEFTIEDSLDTINEKLVRRHPHVFGDKKADAPFEAKQNWEAQKHLEKNRKSRLDGVPVALPALIRAQRLQQKAAYTGFDWENVEDVWAKLHEEIDELKEAHESGNTENIKEEIGDVLFSVVNLSRYFDIPAEDMLRATNKKFIYRFNKIEEVLEARGKKLEESTLEEMEEIWQMAKEKA
ncbi:MAG: nucleoside triphosphate pyrophosphohydrolase [Candidatus Marinimicrobia bacterium]|jgi:MazG family protein|nr:nucleoside triphosphate pyrophosphohydrolase [Candidatus Neomarinimicrobiota bacterium]MBT3496052.1 nucleoside triphosphate pyrophosphohydrolase [Candidatus Neomarinimicrobiota bacterium]MBT3692831.1 nucleoside triphosphate pyrophosphohydrolase [Candidatus Neomarinimicrobiota bacterium]MBT3732181.1 nucleoside triphosphate pyrophosphohydrolase [Candidatus Neomarinimicrobiota bacterium]MBT4144846.1 nucleoside triphosphate pyrophosphohydrolase [Candidatus Neomarinimicrobiota bacterium]